MVVIVIVPTGDDLVIAVDQVDHLAAGHVDALRVPVMSLVVVVCRGAPCQISSVVSRILFVLVYILPVPPGDNWRVVVPNSARDNTEDT